MKNEIQTPSIERDWEIKDRTYVLNGITALTHKIRSKGLLWYDEENNERKEIRYTTNQNSLFVEEQDGHSKLGHVIFTHGTLFVPKSDQPLQKLMSLYHPAKNAWTEINEVKDAENEIDVIELEMEARALVKSLDSDHLEAILRTELGSSVVNLKPGELKRDGYRFAKANPKLFIELSEDEDIKLRNLANRSVEMGILKLSEDGTQFLFATNGKKALTVPFDTNPYAAMAQYFKTDTGIDLMKSIIKKLS